MQNETKDGPDPVSSAERRYVTFRIKKEIYAIDVLRVREVLYLPVITEVPHALPFMKGVIDLRGAVIPVIDTRIKFSLETTGYTGDTVVLIVEFSDRIIGMIVDAVSDVIGITVDDIHTDACFSSDLDHEYVQSITRVREQLIIILDVDKIFSVDEMHRINGGLSAE